MPLTDFRAVATGKKVSRRTALKASAVAAVGAALLPWTSPVAQGDEPAGSAVELEELRKQLAAYFHPPAEYAGDFGKYKSMLTFDDGRPVKTPADWRLRREEISKYWHKMMGSWPQLVEKPKIEYLEKEDHDKYSQQRIRVQVAPDRSSDDAYLLMPKEGQGPFPAVISVFYDGLSGVGGGRASGKPYDFARQMANHGFVALSFGIDPQAGANPSIFYPSKEHAQLQPLAYYAYIASNLYNALAELPTVDPKRVGITGFSHGGKWAMFSSCLDERFACAVWIDPDVVFDETRSFANYWEPWYLGYQPDKERKRGRISAESPRTGAYKQLIETGHDLTELHALMAPRPFLLSGGAEDKLDCWRALNHTVEVNKLLGYDNRIAMTTRETHAPAATDNAIMAAFFEYFLKYGGK